MEWKEQCLLTVIVILGLLFPLPIYSADEVVSVEEIELLESGNFQDSEEWEISSTSGFSTNIAEYSVGMVADNELSITHSRPNNFVDHTEWATTSITNSNNTLGSPDSFYTWSKGPDITMSGYDFSSFNTYRIENVSIVLHISIPEELYQDEVYIKLQNHGPDKLITVLTNVDTPGGLNRMNNPLVISLDNLVEWDWAKIENTQFTIDYASDNIGSDDSEVRVDAVGIRVKYNQPWYSFENVKAETVLSSNELPIIDFGPYEGSVENLIYSTCGLEKEEQIKDGIWDITEIEKPPLQEFGRIHSYGEGNFTLKYKKNDGTFQPINSGELLPLLGEKIDLRILIHDGCIEKIRIDINDPRLIIEGEVTGKTDGLSNSSQVLFAIDNELVFSMSIEMGNFSYSIPIGFAFPEEGDFEVGIATRFQWASDGTSETTVLHLRSIGIEGGFHIEWDYDPECLQMDDLEIDEDQGGLIVPISTRCEDDITDKEDLILTAISMDEKLVEVSSEDGDLRIQPVENKYGETDINISIIDQRGNSWNDTFKIKINSVDDSPVLSDIPLTAYVELGETEIVNISIIDVDTEQLFISTSRSWATIDSSRNLVLTPVQSGTHTVEIVISDGEFEIRETIEVVVSAKPDLTIDEIEVTKSGVKYDILEEGDIVQIISYVRNLGRTEANNVNIQCNIDGILVGQDTIEKIAPGGLGISTCDTQFDYQSQGIEIMIEVDSTTEILETDEENNIMIIFVEVEGIDSEVGNEINRELIIIISSFAVIVVAFAALQLGPKRIKKEFEKIK
ncbi:MAG: hypothetical protein DWB93_04555 [Candidatus Poseidoniales archaeon]|nr:MAG: hypothetical protein DWB93_04555 [Candidatus Poseidoniales archaeon]